MQTGGFGTPTVDDRRAWLWVAMIVSCSYSLLALCVRIFCKWGVLGADEVLLGAAYVSCSLLA